MLLRYLHYIVYHADEKNATVFQACAITKIANITSACDTIYSEPENITYLGFDTIKYDYEIIQYEFVSGADGPRPQDPEDPPYNYMRG